MSSSTVTYTSISSDYEEPSDLPSGDEAPIEDQSLPSDASPTTLSTGYVADSDLKEDPEEDHANCPADGGDGDDEPYDDDDDDDDADDEDEEAFEDEDDAEGEEEHLALSDSSTVPVVDLVPSAGDTEVFETDESAPTPKSPQIIVPPSQTRLCRKRACFTTPAPRFEVGESSAASADAQDDRAFLRSRVNTLFRDRRIHRYRAMLLDREVTYARRAWTGSEDRSVDIEVHVRTLEAQVATLMTQTSSLQTQLTTVLGRIKTLEARDPEPQDEPAKAGSSYVVEKYVGGLSDMMHGSVKASKPKTMQEVGNGNAVARAYVVGTAETNPNSNVVTGTFLLNNRYALILFDTGADRSFVSTVFSSLIDIIPTTLDHGYDVKLADGGII
nr:reverse transcriptase domain-containing protein [Tanacetum cinerariifolium]